jgi:phosphoribosyl 1,2-cyclic phosphodiesterase
MSIEVCVLASGSSGNCAIVRTPTGALMVDAGLGPRTTAKRMDGTGIAVRDVRAICLTHLDRDHFSPTWLGTLLNRGIRVFCHRSRRDDVLEALDHEAVEPLIVGFDEHEPFEPLPQLSVRAVALAHDRTGSHGFVLDGFGCRIGWATDLGRVPNQLHDHFCDLDLLALESNYDPELQLGSARPWFLKTRIMGGAGHLSNEQAFDAVRKILDRCQKRGRPLPAHIVLLHRSRECNCPKLLRKLFETDARIAPRLTLSEQYTRTDWLRVRRADPLVGEQLALAFG